MNDDQLLRYSRHILLDEVGIEGQQAMLDARALIIGAGGLGSPAALYLAASGVGHITLVDDDTVDLTNLQRQIAHTTARVGHRHCRRSTPMSKCNAFSNMPTLLCLTNLSHRPASFWTAAITTVHGKL